MSWLGGSILPKLDASKEQAVTREKWGINFKANYVDHMAEAEQRVREQIRLAEQEDEERGLERQKVPEEELEKVVDSEAKKLLERERSMGDCGTRQIREKSSFNWP